DPTVTSTNHASLVTGFPPALTGVVANKLHHRADPWTMVSSGFAAPFDTETLWEAARRQGRRVAIVAWPGADNRDARRRGEPRAPLRERPGPRPRRRASPRVPRAAGGAARGGRPALAWSPRRRRPRGVAAR